MASYNPSTDGDYKTFYALMMNRLREAERRFTRQRVSKRRRREIEQQETQNRGREERRQRARRELERRRRERFERLRNEIQLSEDEESENSPEIQLSEQNGSQQEWFDQVHSDDDQDEGAAEVPRSSSSTAAAPAPAPIVMERRPPPRDLLTRLENMKVVEKRANGDLFFIPSVLNTFIQNWETNARGNRFLSDVDFFPRLFYEQLQGEEWHQGVRKDENDVLYFNVNNLNGAKTRLFFFILINLAKLPEEVLFNVEANYTSLLDTWNVIGRIKSAKEIPLNDVLDVFTPLYMHIRKYALNVPGSVIIDDEDYDRMYVQEDPDGEHVVSIALQFRQLSVFTRGDCWIPEFETILRKCFPQKGVISVKNEHDFFCFFYTILMGVLQLENPQVFSWSGSYTQELNDELFAKWQVNPVCHQIFEHFGDFVLTTEKFEKILSLQELAKFVRSIEDKIVPETIGLEVYYLNSDKSNKIFPVYISKRKDSQRIQMLNITAKIGEEQKSHFVLITNYAKAVGGNNQGGVFWKCSKCQETFFTRGLLNTHKCPGQAETEKWEWSNLSFSWVPTTPVVGVCEKCHLQFGSEFEFEFHKEHCFMKNKRGVRYVKLSEERYLKADKKWEEEARKKGETEIMFADFECFISKETGKHEVLSYGLYDVKTHEYTQGDDVFSFLMDLKEKFLHCDKIKVFFHNAMNYDANFILYEVLQNKEFSNWGINVLMENSNKLKALTFAFSLHDKSKILKIGDTFKFFTMSLDKLVSSLKGDNIVYNMDHFPHFFRMMREYAGDKRLEISNEEIAKILKKNLFPYNFFDSRAKLETPLDEFLKIFKPFSENLKYFGEGVTVDDLRESYDGVVDIIQTFLCSNAGEYHDLYLRCDVFQIADVFMAARSKLMASHKIDLVDFIGMPSASWQAFRRLVPNLKLELYTDTLFAEYFAQATRGGVTCSVKRYASADPTHTILYLDVNGLYPYVMQEYPYPCGNFDFNINPYRSADRAGSMEDYIRDKVNFLKGANKGFFFTVDMEFPVSIHEQIDDFPFAPEHRYLKDELLDENGEMYTFIKQWAEANGGSVHMTPFKGLVATLLPRHKYSVHGELLVWYIDHGAKITKIWYEVSFDQSSAMLKPYVSYNIGLRNDCRSDDALGKMVYKLMSNSVYGKTFESPFNQQKFIISRSKEVTSGLLEEGKVISYSPIPLSESHDPLDCCVLRLDCDEVVLDKPTYIGACVTEFAKLHMYILFYDKLRAWFKKVELLYTDTDSVIVRIEHPLGFSPLNWMKEYHPEFIGSEGGKVKSETPDNDPIVEFISLRSKVYAYKLASGKVGKRAKGTTTAAQEIQLNWGEYMKCLTSKEDISTENVQFARKGFGVSTARVVKKSLTANDGKRKICDDGINTHAFGFVPL